MTLLEQVQKLAELGDNNWKYPAEYEGTLKKLAGIVNDFNAFGDAPYLIWKEIDKVKIEYGMIWINAPSDQQLRIPSSLLTEGSPEEAAWTLGARVAKVRLTHEKEELLNRLEVINSRLGKIECILTS